MAAAWSSPTPAQATPLQPGFTESVVFNGLTEPTDLAFAPDGHVFVAEKSGLIKVFPNLNATTSTIAADLRTQVYNFWDRGLLSIALDPMFPVRPYLYALYTLDGGIGESVPRWGQPGATSDPCPTPPGATGSGCVASTRLSKLTLSGNTLSSEQVLINDWCQQYPSHSAGGLAFGGDGMLYASGGDGASFTFTDYGQQGQPLNPCGDPPVPAGGVQTSPTAEGGALRAQDIVTPSDPTGLNGSLIRVDPDTGAGAPGNPMSASPDPNARRIVATGMRNPFRFAPRPGTSEIYIGDVGYDAWEEIDRVPRADDATVDNFGWPCYEGVGRSSYEGAGLNLCKQLYNTPGSVTSPHFTYAHGKQVVTGEDCHEAGGSSISGLAFYQGGNYPAAYTGALFFADYSRRCTWVIFEKNGQPDPATRASFLRDNDPVNIEIGPGGDLFVVDFTGSVRRVTYASGNRPPTAAAAAQPQSGPLPLTVNFDGTGSTDPDSGDTLTYAWDLDGDGEYDDSNAAKPSWTYTSAATVTVRLQVTDKGGLSATHSVVIGAGNEPPDAQIDTPTAALHWAVGEEVSFSGKGSDPQDGALGPGSMTWALIVRHCETVDACHSHSIQSYPGVSEGKFTAPDHDYPSHLELRLTVTDSGGLSDTETLRLDPRTVDLTFSTDPAGLSLGVGQQTAATPFTETVIVGSRNTVTAPTPQSQSGSALGFASWSDGGTRTHEIVAPETATTYTATYKPEPAPAGLVLGYGFEETSGTSVTDASPAKNNGTANGATQTASGRFGRALSFDGINDRVDVPDAASLELANALTVEAWVKPTSSRLHAPVVTKETSNFYTYRLEAGGETKGVAEGFISDAAWSWEDAEDTK
ncbi:MAG TPA: PQQ-dependent sugar dehydrogenase, partial [Solirubrobacterales bacterium]|nr:PQQ-dependent sugar dehydrogenase [Solirubrobacterales bacterium]